MIGLVMFAALSVLRRRKGVGEQVTEVAQVREWQKQGEGSAKADAPQGGIARSSGREGEDTGGGGHGRGRACDTERDEDEDAWTREDGWEREKTQKCNSH